MTRVEIVIDDLILRGVPPERAHDVASSLEARLATLAAGSDAALPERAEASRRLPELETTADGLGDSVAGAVWGSIAGDAR
jgi:hypothetical protein